MQHDNGESWWSFKLEHHCKSDRSCQLRYSVFIHTVLVEAQKRWFCSWVVMQSSIKTAEKPFVFGLEGHFLLPWCFTSSPGSLTGYSSGYSWCESKSYSCPVDCGDAVTCNSAAAIGIRITHSWGLQQVWPRSREKPCLESDSIWDWRLCFLAVFLGFNGWQVGSACPGSCGHLWSLWGWHYSGNTSCATDSGCSCEADELACQDPVYRCKSTKFAYDEKIILFAMILYLSPIPGLWMLQMQSKSVQRNGWRWWSCD